MWFIGVDVGGTFTDFHAMNISDGRVFLHKTPSTPSDPSLAIMSGLDALLEKSGIDVDDIEVGEAVAVIVRRMQAAAHRGACHAERGSHVDKRSISLVDVESVGGRLTVAKCKAIPRGQVKVPVVVKIKPNGCICEPLVCHPCFFSHLSEGHVSIVAVEGIASEFAPDIQVLPSVAVVISNGHGMVKSLGQKARGNPNIDKRRSFHLTPSVNNHACHNDIQYNQKGFFHASHQDTDAWFVDSKTGCEELFSTLSI